MKELFKSIGYHEQSNSLCQIIQCNGVLFMITYAYDGRFKSATNIYYLEDEEDEEELD